MDTPADRLRKARIARGFESPTAAARHFGWNEVTYRAHENGTRGLRIAAAKRYARAFRVSLGEMLGTGAGGSLATDSVPVVGSAAWGVWLDMAIAEAGLDEVVSLPIMQDEDTPRRAIKIADNSVDLMIPASYFAVYHEIEHQRIPDLPIGKLVVVKRRMGDLMERTVRRVARHSGGSVYLTSHSSDPRYTGELQVPYSDSTERAAIVGEVVGIYGEIA